MVEDSNGKHGAKDAMHHVVETGHRHFTAQHSLLQTHILNSRKHEAVRYILIKTGCSRCDGTVCRIIVGKDESSKSPVTFQNAVKQVVVSARVDSIHQVEGAH